jgi:hypothetical protein
MGILLARKSYGHEILKEAAQSFDRDSLERLRG